MNQAPPSALRLNATPARHTPAIPSRHDRNRVMGTA